MSQYSVRVKDYSQNITHTIVVWADTRRQANYIAIKRARFLLGDPHARLEVMAPVRFKPQL